MSTIAANAYVGLAGRDEIFTAFASNQAYNINGLDGDDAIGGGDLSDIQFGGLGRDLIFGGAGNDAIYGDQSFADETTSVNQAFAAGADAIFAGSGSDTIFAGGGNNFANGGGDNDLILGGSGNEFLQGGSGDDRVEGGAGNDKLFGGTDAEANQKSFLDANIGQFTTYFNGRDDSQQQTLWRPSDYTIQSPALTNTGADYLDGGAGNDLLDGGDGADTMIGGLGDDTFYVDNAMDRVVEAAGEGTDTVYAAATFGLGSGVQVETLQTTDAAAATAISLAGNEFTQTIYGNAGANTLSAGSGGNDNLLGLGGNDSLSGNGAANYLQGGAGKDGLAGGGGNDIFYFTTALDASTNVDTIVDFANASGNDDTLRIDNAVFAKLANTGPLAGGFFTANADGVAKDSNDYIVYETDTGKLFYDSNGSAADGATQFALLSTKPTLTAADFYVI